MKLVSHGRKVEKFGRSTPKIEGIVATTGLSSLITCSHGDTRHRTFDCFCGEVTQGSTYKKDNTCLVFLGHSFTYINQIQNHINTREVLKVSEQSIFSPMVSSSPMFSYILISSDIMLSCIHSSLSILTKHYQKFHTCIYI